MEQLNTQMSASEKLAVDNAVNTFNKSIVQNGRQVSNELGKDDFLKLLITQLSKPELAKKLADKRAADAAKVLEKDASVMEKL